MIQVNHRRIAMPAGGFQFSGRSYHRRHGYQKYLQQAESKRLFFKCRKPKEVSGRRKRRNL
jgi:DNA-binding LacI/PurR family transcriptional regulator